MKGLVDQGQGLGLILRVIIFSYYLKPLLKGFKQICHVTGFDF